MNSGLSPNIWGPHAWFFFDSICLAYPDDPTIEDKQNYKLFFTNVVNILPCYKCRLNYRNHLNMYPLTEEVMSNKNNLVKWVITMHNLVRKLNKGKEITYDEYINYYVKQYDTKTSITINSNMYVSILFIALIIIIVILYKYKRN